MDIEVKVPNYNLYDTHNIQEELAKNINDIFSDEESFKPPFERKTGMSEALNESPAKTSESRTVQQIVMQEMLILFTQMMKQRT